MLSAATLLGPRGSLGLSIYFQEAFFHISSLSLIVLIPITQHFITAAVARYSQPKPT
jgi:hypothetical protein